MKVFHHPDTLAHVPKLFYRQGALVGHPEQPGRADLLRRSCETAGHEMVALAEPVDLLGGRPLARSEAQLPSSDVAALLRVHDADYLAFLSEAWTRRGELPGAPDTIVATHLARPHMHRRPNALLGQVGYHMADTSTPILAETWRSALASAEVALAGARAVLGGETSAYALCRPPGHHAYADSAGGFCYLNNSAIAAAEIQAATQGGVAIVDIDVHAGNGTQGVFYESADVTTVSVHVDPSDYFPFYAGYADETGAGAGEGHNLNIPLPLGTGDEAWLAAVQHGLRAALSVRPAVLVIALGLDASRDDPLQGMAVTLEGFRRAGALIASARRPTLLVQEGGYLQPSLGDALTAVLEGFG
ncbi:MAG: histone deacetylase family protein [Pseudomonadota bacterium]